MSNVSDSQVEAALAAMNSGVIDARRPFHPSDRDLMRAALAAAFNCPPEQAEKNTARRLARLESLGFKDAADFAREPEAEGR
jgi:hypothetical protein